MESLSFMLTFMVFYTIFNVNQMYSRFVHQYGLSMSCEGRIFDAATMLRAYLSPTEKGHKFAQQILRYMNAAHILGYVGLVGAPPWSVEFFKMFAERHQLLTPREATAILAIDRDQAAADANKSTIDSSGTAYRECIRWALQSAHFAHQQGLLSAMEQQSIERQILALRGKIAGLYDYDFQPVPFAFWNIAAILNFMFLPIFGYSIGSKYYETYYISWLGVFLTSYSLLGAAYLAAVLAKPYGADEYDFDVYHFLNFTIKVSRKLLMPEYCPSGVAFEPSEDPDPGTWGATALRQESIKEASDDCIEVYQAEDTTTSTKPSATKRSQVGIEELPV